MQYYKIHRYLPSQNYPVPIAFQLDPGLEPTAPPPITFVFLPSRAPELNPVENVWQYLRQNWLSNTVCENYDAIVDAACAAWQKLIGQPETITSIGMRDWAHLGQPL